MGDNLLGGTIPNTVGNLGTNITSLDLSQTLLTGTIPSSIGQLTNLTYLNLATNQLTGSIPDSISNLNKLQQLQLQAIYRSSNTLTGTVPPGIFQFPKLGILMLANNKLSGSLPSSGFGLTQLTQIDLTGCQLTGQLPLSIFGNIKLQMLYLSSNKFTGTLELIQELNSLMYLTLDNNQFSGFVPNYFQNTKYGIPENTVLHNNPFLCPLPSWAAQTTGASCQIWKIDLLTPSYADTIFNTPIFINGSNFQNINVYCSFGDVSSPATYISSTSLWCNAPATYNTSRTVNFTLTYGLHPFTMASIPTFVYLGVPIITGIWPNTGREQGSVKVTVTGSNFLDLPDLDIIYCLFGDTFVPGVCINYYIMSVIDSTQIECMTPGHPPGDVPVSVSIDGNSTIGNIDFYFTYFEYCDGLPMACMGNGVCDTSVSPPLCICNTNFVGNFCEDCEHLFFGSQCMQCPDCGSNGTCNATIVGDGLCVCDAGFYGSNCKKCPACENGKCSDGRLGDGKCKCKILWGGKLCNSRWQLYVIIIAPSVVVIIILLVIFIRYRRSQREYKGKKASVIAQE